MHKWTPLFFGTHYPELTRNVRGREVTMKEQMKRIMASTEEDPAPYPFSIDIEKELPELMDDLKPFVHFGRTDRTTHPLMPRTLLAGTVVHEVFFGGRGSSYPWLHYDLLSMHTQITQIMGEKEFILFDPVQTPLLYPQASNPHISSVENIFDPDLEKFPLVRGTRPIRVLLREGETLYFPRGWWHVTRTFGPSITYGSAVVNASNWDAVLDENFARWRVTHPMLAHPARTFSNLLGGVFSALESLKSRAGPSSFPQQH